MSLNIAELIILDQIEPECELFLILFVVTFPVWQAISGPWFFLC